MVKLRAYSKSDAETIIKWITDERMFYFWSADRYDHYPITPNDMNCLYAGSDTDKDFYPLTAYDESGIVGHMIMRYPTQDRTKVRFGFIIVDSAKRGKGYGRRMLQEAVRLAFDRFGAEQITLGVFQNNTPAALCYLSVGFHTPTDPEAAAQYTVRIKDRDWVCCNLELNKKDILQE